MQKDDMISRQAAIDAAKKLLDYYGTNAITKEFADDVAEEFMNNLPSTQPLSEADLTELEGRFGKYVRYVVEDMISGKGERWKT